MRMLLLILGLSLGAAPACVAATDPVVSGPGTTVVPAPAPAFDPARESSSVHPEAEAATASVAPSATDASVRAVGLPSTAKRLGIKPFSALAVQLKMGLGGVGVDLATPLSSRLNLRLGGSFVSYNPHLAEDGMILTGDIQMRSVTESIDFYPFHGAFRISPGFVFYNGNHIQAFAAVPGSQTFTLNDQNYLSNPADPINGTFDLTFGNRMTPSLTIGFGNMIPRKGGHWSTPFEIGAEYLSKPPVVVLALYGSACQQSTDPAYCGSVANDPDTQANVAAEQAQMNASIPRMLRFFPIVSFGVSYRFGHPGRE